MRQVFPSLALLASPALALAAPGLSCDEIWKDVKSHTSYCWIKPPVDASAGIILSYDENGRLQILDGKHSALNKEGKKIDFYAENSQIFRFISRFALKDGSLIEVYEYDSLNGLTAFQLIDSRGTYRPFPNTPDYYLRPLESGDYVLANGKNMRIEHGAAFFPEWQNEGIPDFLLPSLELNKPATP